MVLQNKTRGNTYSKGKIEQRIAMYPNANSYLYGFRFVIQVLFKEIQVVEFWCRIKKYTHNYLKRLLKYSSLFQLYLEELNFPQIL